MAYFSWVCEGSCVITWERSKEYSVTWRLNRCTTIISWVRRNESSLKSFDVQILVLPRATFLVSNGNNIVAHKFARFAAIDVNPDKSPLETEPVSRDNIKI